MSPRRWPWVVCFMAALTIVSACGEPPEKEMQQAQGAIDAARAVGADQYAHDEFVAAQDTLKRAREAIDQRDYRLALNHALDSRERAQNAARIAADQRGAARADADRAIADAAAALADARLKLKAVETAHIAPAKTATARAAIADGEQQVQEARAAFGRGEYAAATATISGTAARLRAAGRDLATIVASAPHRRR
jgi:hypothetical protein